MVLFRNQWGQRCEGDIKFSRWLLGKLFLMFIHIYTLSESFRMLKIYVWQICVPSITFKDLRCM